MKHGLFVRKKIEVNTDPQRRCYNGCHFSSEMVWTGWTLICPYTELAVAKDTMESFQKINPSREYKIEEVEE